MRTPTLVLPLVLLACDPESNLTAQERVLDSFSYVDAGAVAMNDRQPFSVPLFSQGVGDVRIFEIAVEDVSSPEGAITPAFLVSDDTWAEAECDANEDGLADCRNLAGYDDESDDDSLELVVYFAPTQEGYYEGLLTIWSNDNTSQEKLPLPDTPETEATVWRVQVRGLSRPGCGEVVPPVLDFSKRPLGGDFSESVEVRNCGIVPLTVSAISFTDTVAMASRTLPPLYVLPGQSEEVVVGWNVGSTDPERATLTFAGNSDQLEASTVSLYGNDCENSLSPIDWDADLDGWTSCGGDCNDDPFDDGEFANPSRSETADDRIDNDCDGEIDEADDDSVGEDDDGDGCSESGSDCGSQDCDDSDALIAPGAPERLNRLDDDCDGVIDENTEAFDDDGDGWAEVQGDCDDATTAVSPAAEEVVDGRDNDCDSLIDEGGVAYDDDGDGTVDVESDPTLSDCDDQDPWVFVGAREYCDGYDNDCDGRVDDGEDDAEGGACAFVPERVEEVDTGTEKESSGCAAGGLGVSLSGAALAFALVRRRSRG